MRRYVVTGAPGAGKTVVLGELAARGYHVVAEAATDVIAGAQAQGRDRPWAEPGFVDAIVAVQRERQERPVPPGVEVALHDRSPICTLALARYLGVPVPDPLAAEADRVVRAGIYQRRVFFLDNLGYVTPSAARRIGYRESIEFERVHEWAYRSRGYELVRVPRGAVGARAATIDGYLRSWR